MHNRHISSIKQIDPYYHNSAPNTLSEWTKKEKGQITHYFHPIIGKPESQIDYKNSLPVTVVNGRADGPTILIIAGEHGNEYENIAALQETLCSLNPKQINGRVVGINCCSVDSYRHDMRESKLDGLNWVETGAWGGLSLTFIISALVPTISMLFFRAFIPIIDIIQLASAVATRSVGAKASPLPSLSFGASVNILFPDSI